MKPAALAYARPGSVEEAVEALEHGGEDAKVLAGGQSLVPLLNMRFTRPSLLVDVNRVEELGALAEANGGVRAGAIVRQAAFEASPLVRSRVPLAAEALPHVGHFVTRNRGTVGGSIAHADASGELPLALVTLGGRIHVTGPGGRRELAADDFFVTHFTTALQPGELVVETIWPGAPPGSGSAFEELALRAGDYALSMAACVLRLEGGRVSDASIALGAVVDRPTRIGEAEALVRGNAVDAELAREAGARAAAATDPAGGLHASAGYLRHVTALLVGRALTRAWRNALEAPA